MCAYQKFLEHPKTHSKFGTSILRSSLIIVSLLLSLSAQAQNDFVEPAPPEIPHSPLRPEKLETPVDPEITEEPTEEVTNPVEEQDGSASPEDTQSPSSDSVDTSQESPEEVPEYFKNIMNEIDGNEEPTANTSVGEEGLSILSQAVGRMVIGLSIVLAMILILYFLVRRYGKNVPALSGYQLGQIIGQVHLSRSATLHYVKSGGRILVIGVNDGGVNLVAEYDESAFATISGASPVQGDFDPESFVDELKQQTAAIRGEESSTSTSEVYQDDDISALRGDINRLQEYLQEENREQND